MKAADLNEDSVICDWFKLRKCRENSIKAYLQGMQEFTELLGMTPTQLLEEAEREEDENIKMRSRKIKRYLLDYSDCLEKKNLAPMTVKNRLAAVKSFYVSNDIQLPAQARSENRAKPLQKNMKIPTKNDLREVLKFCDPLEKAILLTGVSTGLAINEITELKIKDFLDYYDDKTQIATLKLRREKTNYDFITFTTPEASKAIFEYLNYRNREAKEGYSKERRNLQLAKQRVYSKDGYLFICRRINDKYHKTKNEELRKLNERTVMGMYRQVSEDSQKNAEFGSWNLLRSHNLRRLCYSILLNAGADIFFTDFILGHQIDSVKAAYFRADPEKLKEIYARYIDNLTIQELPDIKKHPDYIKAKNESESFAKLAATATIENEQFESLNKKIKEIKNELLSLKEKEEEEESIKGEVMALLVAKSFPAEFVNNKEIEKKLTYMKANPAYSQILKKYESIFENSDSPEAEILLEEDEKENKYKKVMNRLLELK